MFRLIALRRAAPAAAGRRVPASAVSAFSGNSYPAAIAEKLAALGFSSNLWLTERQMAQFGVTLKDSEKAKGFKSSTSDGHEFMLYNADQTSDAAKVASMKGRGIVTNALTKQRIRGQGERNLNERLNADKFSKNEWLSDRDVDSLGLSLKKDAKPTEVSYEFQDVVAAPDGTTTTETRTVTQNFYNVDQLVDVAVLERARKVYPISAATGRKYNGRVATTLLRHALEKNLTSPHWTTLSGAQSLGIFIKDGQEPISVSVTDNKIVDFYNASQTSDPAKVAAAAYKALFSPRSAMSGSIYPEPTQGQLSSAAVKRKYRSVYWLTERQATFFSVQIRDGEVPVEAVMPDGVVRLFNAEQTTNKDLIESRFNKKK
eukprot:PhM_4_TR747/c0_g1_i1/m.43304